MGDAILYGLALMAGSYCAGYFFAKGAMAAVKSTIQIVKGEGNG